MSTETPANAELAAKILKQVEFYFGDANLPKDKFLWNAVSANPAGWVPLDTLLTFNRLRALTADKKVLADALRGSLGLLEVDEAGENVRRVRQLSSRTGAVFKTIWANNFPTDLADPISEIEKFFSTAGKVDFVKVFYTTDSNEAIADAADKGEEVKEDATAEESKKDEGAEEAKEGAAEAVKEKKERKFAGAAFVEFADSKDAKKAKEMKWKMGERDIEVVSKSEWIVLHRPKTDADKRSATVDPSLSMPPRNVTLPYIVDEPRVILRTTGRLVHASELPKVSMDVVRAAFREHGFVEWIAYKSGETVAFALYDKKKKKEDKKEAEEEAMKEAEEVAGWKEEEEKPAAEGDKEEKKEEAQIDLVEKVLKRMAEKSGEEGKMKLADDLVVVRRATEAEEQAFYDDYEAQIKRIEENKKTPAQKQGRGGRQGGGGGGGRGQKRKGGEQGGRGKRSRNDD